MNNRNLVPRSLDIFDVLDNLLGNPPVQKRSSVLAVDVKENDTQYTVLADMPGVAKENINVSFNKGQLLIEVEERKINETEEGEKNLLSERYYSKKSRVLNIGDNVDSENIKASYTDGVLQLQVPKKEAPNTLKQIIIN